MDSDVVHRTQVYLDDEEIALLAAASERTGASRSELLRRAVRARYGGAATRREATPGSPQPGPEHEGVPGAAGAAHPHPAHAGLGVEVQDLPDHDLAVLSRRADRAGQSLRAYILDRLVEEAGQPTLEELLARVDAHAGGSVSLDAATRMVRAERDER